MFNDTLAPAPLALHTSPSRNGSPLLGADISVAGIASNDSNGEGRTLVPKTAPAPGVPEITSPHELTVWVREIFHLVRTV